MRLASTSKRLAWAAAMLFLALAGAARAQDIPAQDVAGSHDSPFVPRIGGARIIAYDQADDDEAILPEAGFKDFGFTATRTLEGRITRIAYAFPKAASEAKALSTVAIMNHYKDVLKGAGFKTVFQCPGGSGSGSGCGGFSFGEGLTQPMVDAHPGAQGDLIIDFLHPVGNDIRYLLATLDRPEGKVTLALAVARRIGRSSGMFVETVEQKPDSAAAPVSSAALIASALRIQGRIALYGIHFASDKATIRPDSHALLAQVSQMLLADPAMRVIVVDHSDNSDTLAHELELSAARAQAVMQALVAQWKVPAAQLTSMGVGPAAPLASNADETGRALNRRIELVVE